MQKIKRAVVPFIAAVAGGLIVAVFGGSFDSDSPGDTGGESDAVSKVVSAKAGKDLSVGQIYDGADGGVAFIRAGDATGSGFVIDDEGHVVTNAHVVAQSDEFEVTLDNERSYDAELVGSDPSTDIAVLDIEADTDELEPLALGDSKNIAVGDPVVAIGNPFGLDRTVTAGIVSGLQRQVSAPDGFTISDVIQTDAPINPGNSGGPLISAAGEVVGVNSQIESTTGGNVGIGFAVPIDTAADVAQTLISDGSIEHAYLGLAGGEADGGTGALVASIVDGSPADDAGVERGDVITSIDGEPVDSMEDVITRVNALQPGDDVDLRLLADGDERTVTVTLGDRPDRAVS